MKKKSFVLYTDNIDIVEKLSDEQAGKLLKAVMRYQSDGTIPDDLDPMTDIVFMVIKGHLDRDGEKYAEICKKRSEAGKKGRAQATKNKQMLANANKSKQMLADNDNENENDNDIDIVNENVSENENDGILNDPNYSDEFKNAIKEIRAFKERKQRIG